MAVPNNDASTTRTLAAFVVPLVLSPKRQWRGGGGKTRCCRSRHFFKAGWVDTSAWFRGSAIITTVKTTFAVVSCSCFYNPSLSWTHKCYVTLHIDIFYIYLSYKSKNTGAWKGRLERFFVDLYPVELAKNGTNIFWRYSKNKQFLFHAQRCGSKIEPATPLWILNYECI